MIESADFWINKLRLEPHPEGGYFKETYRSSGKIAGEHLPAHTGDRVFSTAIYYLLSGAQFSAFHRLNSDEMWHFYAGTTLALYLIDSSGDLQVRKLGRSEADAAPQMLIPADTWFAGRCLTGRDFCLAGCTVAPGFDFADFEMGRRSELISRFPQHKSLILELTQG